MKQKPLIIEYIKEHGSILPAKIGGKIYKGTMFGSETSKRCRELRADGKLESKPDGKFERFYLKGTVLIGFEEKTPSPYRKTEGIIQDQLLTLNTHID
jgi:hypothetical protein